MTRTRTAFCWAVIVVSAALVAEAAFPVLERGSALRYLIAALAIGLLVRPRVGWLRIGSLLIVAAPLIVPHASTFLLGLAWVVAGAGGAKHGREPLAAGICLAALGFALLATGWWNQHVGATAWLVAGALTGEVGSAHLLGLSYVYAGPLWVGCSVAVVVAARAQLRHAMYIGGIALLAAITSIAFSSWLIAMAGAGVIGALGAAFSQPQADGLFRPAIQWAWGKHLAAAASAIAITASVLRQTTDDVSAAEILFVQGSMAHYSPADRDPGTELKSPNFHGLLEVARVLGMRARVCDAHQLPEFLPSARVAVIANPTEVLHPAAKNALHEWARAGGRLLVLADHTDIGGTRAPLNDLLSATGIRVRFDSAIPDDSPAWRWRDCIRENLHPVFTGRATSYLGISVGASLDTGPRAAAIVVGERALGDIGRPDYGVSRLGDMSYTPGEVRGSLALVAEERLVHGIVQVWGDTSTFQTGQLAHTFDLVASDFIYLAGGQPPRLGRWSALLGSLLAAAVIVWRGPVTMPLLCAAPAVLLPVLATHAMRLSPIVMDVSRLVVADDSVSPLQPSIPEEGAFSWLADACQRNGLLLVRGDAERFLRAGQPRAVILAAPSRPLRNGATEALLRYASDGGRLIITTGYSRQRRLGLLLDRLRATVDPVVLGPAQGAVGPQDQTIRFAEAFALAGTDLEALVTCWSHVAAGRVSLGRGDAIIIGDDRFLCNRNLGLGTRRADPEMARFVCEAILPQPLASGDLPLFRAGGDDDGPAAPDDPG